MCPKGTFFVQRVPMRKTSAKIKKLTLQPNRVKVHGGAKGTRRDTTGHGDFVSYLFLGNKGQQTLTWDNFSTLLKRVTAAVRGTSVVPLCTQFKEEKVAVT